MKRCLCLGIGLALIFLNACAKGPAVNAETSAAPPASESRGEASPGSAPADVVARVVEDPIEQIRVDAKALEPLVTSNLGRAFLAASEKLVAPVSRKLFADEATDTVYAEKAAAALDAAVREKLVPMSERETIEFYYNTYHGTPLAYSRAIDLVGQAGVEPADGQRLVDFGFGNIGQLRLLASLGFDTVGIDVAAHLGELYADPADQGSFGSGSVKIAIGRYPKEAAIAEAAGANLDVFLSKNTLKRGYIHPYRTPANPKWVIDLGVSDEVFLESVRRALKPGGKFMIYNICPAPTPADKPFVPWTDGRSPFSREQFAAAGFKVLAFDVDDTAFVRTMGHRLRWDQEPEAFDLQNDLSVLYTLVERAR